MVVVVALLFFALHLEGLGGLLYLWVISRIMGRRRRRRLCIVSRLRLLGFYLRLLGRCLLRCLQKALLLLLLLLPRRSF